MKPKKPSPSRAARQAAKRIRNTKAELLDIITGQIEAIVMICHTNELKLARWRIAFLLRQQLEKRLWDALLELLAFEERELGRGGYGYTRADMMPILEIRELFK